MPHINLTNEYPGIRSLFIYRPETAAPLNALVQAMLHNPHPSLSAGERELIASYTSSLNQCKYCANTLGAMGKVQQSGMAVKQKRLSTDNLYPKYFWQGRGISACYRILQSPGSSCNRHVRKCRKRKQQQR